MPEIIDLACSIDRSYLQHIVVTLTSLFENNKSCRYRVHLFSGEFKENELSDITTVVNKYGQEFQFYFLDHSLFDGFFLSNHITVASYYRIFIPKILGESTNKLLYLDADLIIKKDLNELWKTNVTNVTIAGIPDPNQDNINNSRLSISLSHKYLNAGVLIINTKKWIEKNLTEVMKSFILNNSDIIYFHDQDTLNKILFNDCIKLPPKWNQQSAIFELPRKKLIEVYGEKELDEAINDPAIIHYTGSSKPWDYLNLHPYKKEYFKYLEKTIWKNYTYPNVTLTKRLQKLLMRIFGVKGFQKMVTVTSSNFGKLLCKRVSRSDGC